MRTVILVGLLSIADSINSDWMNNDYAWFYVLLAFFAVISDVSEITRRKND